MIIPNNLCLGNVSKDFWASNMKKTGFNGYIYDFSVDENNYLMKKKKHSIKNVQIYEANICFSDNAVQL